MAARIVGLAMPPMGGEASDEIYVQNLATLRDVVAQDHFGGDMSSQIIDGWLEALKPGSRVPLPPHIKGLYGGDLRASIPIELARASYKFIKHEVNDAPKLEKYALRMLISLSTLGDLRDLACREPTLAVVALWHKALALVRLPHSIEQLSETLRLYAELRPGSPLPDSKLPRADNLRRRLGDVAVDVNNVKAVAWLSNPT